MLIYLSLLFDAATFLDAHNRFLVCLVQAPNILLQCQRTQSTRATGAELVGRSWCSYVRNNSCSYSTSTTTTPPTTTGLDGVTVEEFRVREEKREQAHEERTQSDKQTNKEAKEDKVNAVRKHILEAALQHVPALGWTRDAIVQGAEDAGFPSVVHGMFPEGGYALVSYYTGKCNADLVKQLKEETDNGQKPVTDPGKFLVHAIRKRLEMIAPFKGQWPQALALMAVPQNAPTALAQLLTLVDDICYYAGDRSVDLSWYTRRVGVATILKITELYLLQDNSLEHANTWKFLENRLDEAVQLQTMLSQTEGVTHKFHSSFSSAFVTARNMLGLGYDRK